MALWRPYAYDVSLDLPKPQVQGAPAESSSSGNSPESPHPQFLENCPQQFPRTCPPQLPGNYPPQLPGNCPPQFPGNCPPLLPGNCPPLFPGNRTPQLPRNCPPQFPENCLPQLPVPPYYAPYGVCYGSPLELVSPSRYDAVPGMRTTPPESSVASAISDNPEFKDFEENAMRVVAAKNGGALVGTNPLMRRCVRASSAGADDAYLRQRERNNLAAKLSRDRRKRREVHLAQQVAHLNRQVAALKDSLSKRACVRCNQPCLC